MIEKNLRARLAHSIILRDDGGATSWKPFLRSRLWTAEAGERLDKQQAAEAIRHLMLRVLPRAHL